MVKTSGFGPENSGSSPDEAANPPPPLCVFCNAPWTEDMTQIMCRADVSNGYYDAAECDGCDIKIDVICSTCNRLVYRKEVRKSGNDYWW